MIPCGLADGPEEMIAAVVTVIMREDSAGQYYIHSKVRCFKANEVKLQFALFEYGFMAKKKKKRISASLFESFILAKKGRRGIFVLGRFF